MNKRGSIQALLQLVAMISALALMGSLALFVHSKTDSTAFFQEFQTKDLGLFLETISASPGELITTYSNMKQGLPLRYEFSKGEVKGIIFTEEAKDLDPTTKTYGTSEQLIVNDVNLLQPAFFVFLKSENKLVIKEDVSFRSFCKFTEEKTFNRAVKITGNGAFAVETAIRKVVLESTAIQVIDQEEGREITVMTTDIDKIIIEAQGAEESFLACVIKEQFETFTDAEITIVNSQEKRIVIQANTTEHAFDTIGKVIGRGVLIYANK